MSPYSKFFHSFSNIDNLNTRQIKIRSDPDLDQRVYNTPIASKVAIVWTDENTSANNRIRDKSSFNL